MSEGGIESGLGLKEANWKIQWKRVIKVERLKSLGGSALLTDFRQLLNIIFLKKRLKPTKEILINAARTVLHKIPGRVHFAKIKGRITAFEWKKKVENENANLARLVSTH